MRSWEEKEGHFSRKAQHLLGMVEVVWPEFREHAATVAGRRWLGHGESLQSFEQGNELTRDAV